MRRELLYPAIEDEPTAYDFLSPARLVRARRVNLPIYLAEAGPGQSTSLIDATIAELCRLLPAARRVSAALPIVGYPCASLG
jgi:hypothetical protein